MHLRLERTQELLPYCGRVNHHIEEQACLPLSHKYPSSVLREGHPDQYQGILNSQKFEADVLKQQAHRHTEQYLFDLSNQSNWF